MDRYEACGEGHFGFGLGEIAFRTDHHDDFGAIKSVEHLLDAPAWNPLILKAIRDQSKGVACLSSSLVILSGNELLHRNRLIDNRHDSLERLLRGADQNLLDTCGLQNPSFRMFSDHWRQLIKSDLASLLGEPFIPVVVLGRAHCKMEPVRMSSPAFLRRKHHGLHSLRAVDCYAAAVKCAAAVYH